ncbi:hypothetical protein ACHAW5_002441 [Stephanodiscus triporus]|uniref:Uncharacterized protein n=1 Tax=Stephanodiscus triporus TaxID=2934178 RepID=A0ABD3PN50_9STRA
MPANKRTNGNWTRKQNRRLGDLIRANVIDHKERRPAELFRITQQHFPDYISPGPDGRKAAIQRMRNKLINYEVDLENERSGLGDEENNMPAGVTAPPPAAPSPAPPMALPTAPATVHVEPPAPADDDAADLQELMGLVSLGEDGQTAGAIDLEERYPRIPTETGWCKDGRKRLIIDFRVPSQHMSNFKVTMPTDTSFLLQSRLPSYFLDAAARAFTKFDEADPDTYVYITGIRSTVENIVDFYGSDFDNMWSMGNLYELPFKCNPNPWQGIIWHTGCERLLHTRQRSSTVSEDAVHQQMPIMRLIFTSQEMQRSAAIVLANTIINHSPHQQQHVPSGLYAEQVRRNSREREGKQSGGYDDGRNGTCGLFGPPIRTMNYEDGAMGQRRGVKVDSYCSVAGVEVAAAEQHGDVTALRGGDLAAASSCSSKPQVGHPRKKKRICKFPRCSRTVKAQGHCQKHGAKIKRCKALGCTSQAQGSHEGYCKRHWRELLAPMDHRKKPQKEEKGDQMACEPVGSSVYDYILPASFAWKSEVGGGVKSPQKEHALEGRGVTDREDKQMELIPILKHLVENQSLDPGWHRTNERLARGIRPSKSLSTQLESWEKQLAVLEMALIAGTDTSRCLTQHMTSKVLAHAWGREKGFHKIMIEKHCSRRGELERKKRVDAGVPTIPEKRVAYKTNRDATKAAKKRKLEELSHEQLAHGITDSYGVAALPVPGGEVPMSVNIKLTQLNHRKRTPEQTFYAPDKGRSSAGRGKSRTVDYSRSETSNNQCQRYYLEQG